MRTTWQYKRDSWCLTETHFLSFLLFFSPQHDLSVSGVTGPEAGEVVNEGLTKGCATGGEVLSKLTGFPVLVSALEAQSPVKGDRRAQPEGHISPKAVTQVALGLHRLTEPPLIHPAILKPNIKIKQFIICD